MMSCDNSDLFIRGSNDRMIGHTLYTWLWKFQPLKVWNALNGKSDTCSINSPSAILANCLKLHTLLTVEVAFSPWLWPSHIHVILFCNLIGDARFQASYVNGLTPQCYQGLSYHVLVRGNEPVYELGYVVHASKNCWDIWIMDLLTKWTGFTLVFDWHGRFVQSQCTDPMQESD